MNIIQANWEKENLGVSTVEIIIDNNDKANEVADALNADSSEYQVVKAPVGNMEIVRTLERSGFNFAETIFSLSGKVAFIDLPHMYSRFKPNIDIINADPKSNEVILQKIRNGDIFKTDRIALDPFFSLKDAGNRYYNWMSKELKTGATMNIALFRNTPVAFSVCKGKGEVCDNLLGGIIDNNGAGVGFLSVYASHVYAERENYIYEKTSVSSNNPAILKLHMMYGFSISEMKYVFIKHN